MSRWKRRSAASATRASTSESVRRSAGDSGVGRFIPSAAPQLERKSGVVRGLIGPRKGRQRRVGVLQIGIGHFEAVEPAPRHEKYLIAAHVAGGPQLAAEFPVFAQQPRLGVTASFAWSGKAAG